MAGFEPGAHEVDWVSDERKIPAVGVGNALAAAPFNANSVTLSVKTTTVGTSKRTEGRFKNAKR